MPAAVDQLSNIYANAGHISSVKLSDDDRSEHPLTETTASVIHWNQLLIDTTTKPENPCF